MSEASPRFRRWNKCLSISSHVPVLLLRNCNKMGRTGHRAILTTLLLASPYLSVSDCLTQMLQLEQITLTTLTIYAMKIQRPP